MHVFSHRGRSATGRMGKSGQVPFLLAEEVMEPDDLLCSRNARSRTPLVGRAQWEINQSPSLKKERASLEGSSVASFDARTRGSTRLPCEEKSQAKTQAAQRGLGLRNF